MNLSNSAMKFGVVLPSFGKDGDQESLLSTSQAAERLGFDSIWLTDHIALPESDAERFGHIYEAISTLAYLAGTTQRIGLGTSVLILPQRNPVEVAKQIATIDALSGGRVVLAAGVGWSRGEYDNLGYNFHNRGRRMDEALKVLKTLWSATNFVSFHGKFYHFERVMISPLPAQLGGPPVWIGGSSPAALRRAVTLGDGWHPNAHSPAALREALKTVQPGLNGRDFKVCLRIHLKFDQENLPEKVLHGTSQQVVNQILAYQDAGMTDLAIDFEAENMPARLRALERFAGEVMPRFR